MKSEVVRTLENLNLRKRNSSFFFLFAITFLGLFASQDVGAQPEFYNWYFGNNAGLNFNFSPPQATTNGALVISDQTSTMSDHAGNLMMYSSGLSVWNRNHSVMPNGTDLLGAGAYNSHASIIVGQPGSANRYYIFSIVGFGYAEGLKYSIVDMSLDGGNGAVISKANPLIAPVGEKLTGVHHSNGTDIWIITHELNSDAFYAYLLTASGVSAPVITHIGSFHYGVDDAAGQLAASADGSRLAMATYGQNYFSLFDFNATTGVVSNEIRLNGFFRAWGVQFSPDATKLYCTEWTMSKVLQFDITSGNSSGIMATQNIIGYATSPDPTYSAGFLQTGPDKKIYIAKMNAGYVSVINDPNNAGSACGFVDNGAFLNGRICQAGLPQFILSVYYPPVFNISDVCEGDTMTVQSVNLNLFSWLQWDFGDPASGVNNTSALIAPTHLYNTPGVYVITLYCQQGSVSDTVQRTITVHERPVVHLPEDTLFCDATSFELSPGNAGMSYLWSTGATTPSITVNTSGNYWVSVTNGYCSATDSISLLFPHYDLVPPITGNLCGGSATINMESYYPYSSFLWNDSSGNSTHTFDNEGIYTVAIQNACGSYLDTVLIAPCPECNVDLPTAFTPNGDGINDIFRLVGDGYMEYSLIIFNRHGEQVFQSEASQPGWDGTYKGVLQENEVYFYYLTVKCLNGKTYTKKGDVTLIR